MIIDCDTCRMREVACADCVVSLLLAAPDESADFTESETSALAALAQGGLLPPLRLVPVAATPPKPQPRLLQRRAKTAGLRQASAS